MRWVQVNKKTLTFHDRVYANNIHIIYLYIHNVYEKF